MVKNKTKVTLNKPKWKAGRPDKIDEKLLAKIEEWFMLSLTDDECCLYVNINPSTLYRYIEKNPEFWKRRELLKRTPNIKAKENWVKEIKQGTYASSKEWLERKAKDEFSTKEIIDQTTKQVNYSKDEWEWMSDEELDGIANW